MNLSGFPSLLVFQIGDGLRAVALLNSASSSSGQLFVAPFSVLAIVAVTSYSRMKAAGRHSKAYDSAPRIISEKAIGFFRVLSGLAPNLLHSDPAVRSKDVN